VFTKIYKKKQANAELNQKINTIFKSFTQNEGMMSIIMNTQFSEKEKKDIDLLLIL